MPRQYRGCDNCQRQKKKCSPALPRCTRCERLNIPCVGRDQLRYKFKGPSLPVKQYPDENQATRHSPTFHRWAPPRCLYNETTSLTSRLIAVLSVTDPRFDLESLGTWLVDIPSHLGNDQLLDTATTALTTAVQDLQVGKQSRASFSSYGKAINCLTEALRDPVKVKAPYTLAAVFMITLCQPWLSLKADYVNHIQGMAQLLNLSAGEEWKSAFAETLRFHLIFPVYLAMAVSPDIKIDSWYSGKYSKSCSQLDASSDQAAPSIQSLGVAAIMRYPTILRDPELYGIELRVRYEQALLDGESLRAQLRSLDGLMAAAGILSLAPQRAQVQLRLAYVAVLYYSLIMNAYMYALDPRSPSPPTDAITMAKEAVDMASVVFQSAPISLGFMPLCLFAASLATTDSKVLDDIEEALLDYKDHFVEWHHRQRFHEAKQTIEGLRTRRLAQLRDGSGCEGDDLMPLS